MLNRRMFLALGSSVWASALMGADMHAVAEAASSNRDQARFTTLSPDLARNLDAFAARILPSGETPGAREAGAIWFIDASLTGILASALPLVEAGMQDLNARVAGEFADASEAEQDQLLRSIEGGQFFELTRVLVIAGTFTMPKYGGNRDELGWNMLGYESRHFWEPPFGYYDAQRMQQAKQPSAPPQARADSVASGTDNS